MYGHLQMILPEEAFRSFSKCASAAQKIALLLESYQTVHSFKLAPYMLFYASFVASTIHVRLAAQKQLDTDAFRCLQICLKVYDANIISNPAVKKAKLGIQKLMDKMGVRLPQSLSVMTVGPEQPIVQSVEQMQSWNMEQIDFDAILQSFGRPPEGNAQVSASSQPGINGGSENFYYPQFMDAGGVSEDVMFGFDMSGLDQRIA